MGSFSSGLVLSSIRGDFCNLEAPVQEINSPGRREERGIVCLDRYIKATMGPYLIYI
jgi:hypothetical protein